MGFNRSEMESIQWFHSIDLGYEVTSGFKQLDLLRAEADVIFSYPVAGKTVLDIGAWDGFFSFEAERRGASRVLATDWFCWSGPGWGTQAGFNFARAALGSRVEDREIDVPNISPETTGMFDVVLLSGVLYHVKDPLGIIEKVAAVTRECLVIETAVALVNVAEPAMALLHVLDRNKDPTNWWAPNPACVMEMLKVSGFKNVLVGQHPTNSLNHQDNPRCYFFATR